MASETTSQTETGLSGAVAQHYNKLEEKGLDERTKSRIFYLRNFNNWIKSMAISDALQKIRQQFGSDARVSVLDLCSGKGGDLLKWRKGKIDRLVCADIAGTSVEQCEARYKEMVDRAAKERFPQKIFIAEDFITADCTKVRLKDQYKSPATQFHLVSCQFSFHYCFESLPQAEMMVRNACECLKPGGFFIGTTPNSHELVKRMRVSENDSFGNEVYRVTFDPNYKDKQPPLFGAKYDFHLEGVVDCPEFLVYFPAFERLAAKYGMKLVSKKTFAEYFEEQINKGDGRGLIGRMQGLEPYPPEEDVDLMSKQQEAYTAAQQKLEELKAQGGDQRRQSKVGTLSKDEWEATSIYLVFAFQKTPEDTATSAPVNESPRASKRAHDRDQSHDADESPSKKQKAS